MGSLLEDDGRAAVAAPASPPTARSAPAFSLFGHDLYGVMRRGAPDEELRGYIRGVIMKKEARHPIGEPDFQESSRSMVHIGGRGERRPCAKLKLRYRCDLFREPALSSAPL